MIKLLILTVLVVTTAAAFTRPETHNNFLRNSIANRNNNINIIRNKTGIDRRDDPCYDSQTGIGQRCIPPFENVAFNKQVIASSQCGAPEMSYCIQPLALNRNLMQSNANRNNNKHCDVCDAKRPDKFQGTQFLTDLEETNSTCWISEPVYKPTEASNITLKISFGKKYELTYISMQFCTALKPDSVSIMKSMDHGRTWVPFQFYSSDCERVFSRALNVKITKANEQEPVCTDQHLKNSPFNTNRIGFSTLEGRPSFSQFDTSPVLQDWVTATDIKIVFDRLLSPHVMSKFQAGGGVRRRGRNSFASPRRIRSQVRSQMDQLGYFYAAVSELAIGGRCKCNGHASRCVLNNEGKYQCDCKHNTAGLECERCLPFHYDRPWSRATSRGANECVACNCNNHSSQCRFNTDLYRVSGDKKSGGVCLNCQHNTMGRFCHYCQRGFYRDSREPIQSERACKACNCNNHSNKCRFNKDLYLLSGRKSGGLCVNCRHNTAGRNCHYCRDSFYRDHSYPMNHQRACRECNCHQIGSASKNCDQSSGQCKCKEGVTGVRCDRCMSGYKQSNSPITPCEKIGAMTTTTTTTTTSTTTMNPLYNLLGQNGNPYFNYAKYSEKSTAAAAAENKNDDYYYDYNYDTDDSCDYCKTKSERVTFKEFCKNEYVFLVKLIDQKPEDGKAENLDTKIQGNNVYSKFESDIVRMFKGRPATSNNYYEIVSRKRATKMDAFNLKRNEKINMWMDNRDLACACPELSVSRKYLVMTKSYSLVQYLSAQGNRSSTEYAITRSKLAGVLLDRETFITEWQGTFLRRMRRFNKYNRAGRCSRFNYN